MYVINFIISYTCATINMISYIQPLIVSDIISDTHGAVNVISYICAIISYVISRVMTELAAY